MGYPIINYNRTESKINNNHYNIYNAISKKIYFTNLNFIESESYCNYCNMYNVVSKEIFFTEEIQLNYFISNHFRSKYYSDNIIDSNYNIENRLNNIKL